MGFSTNDDVYLTWVYQPYDSSENRDYYDDFMRNNNADKLLFYVNGKLFGYTYQSHSVYAKGLSKWNNDDCPFFVGVCMWDLANLYYLKGQVYCTRLYQNPMTASEVKENMDMTQKYRASF